MSYTTHDSIADWAHQVTPGHPSPSSPQASLPREPNTMERPSRPRTPSPSHRRRHSPRTIIYEIGMAPQPILFRNFSGRSPGELPQELEELIRTIEGRFAREIGVVADKHQAEIQLTAGEAFRFIDDYALTAPDKLPGPSPTPEKCEQIVLDAECCDEDGFSEPNWHGSVYIPVLRLALGVGHRDDVYYTPCTGAQISPTSLIPPGQAATAIKADLVDFVLNIKQSPQLRAAVNQRAQLQLRRWEMSVNPTLFASLCFYPIGVSIKSKRTGGSYEEALLQVGVWVAAHFAKLEEMVEETRRITGRTNEKTGALPFLPLIIIIGHDWSFAVAVRSADKQTVVYNKIGFGSTGSTLGVYQIVATLQLLACWVRGSFEGWFLEYCLGVTP